MVGFEVDVVFGAPLDGQIPVTLTMRGNVTDTRTYLLPECLAVEIMQCQAAVVNEVLVQNDTLARNPVFCRLVMDVLCNPARD